MEFLARALEKIQSLEEEKKIKRLQRFFESMRGKEFLSETSRKYGLEQEMFEKASIGTDWLRSWPAQYRLVLHLNENDFARAVSTGRPEKIHYTFRQLDEGGGEWATLIVDIDNKIEIVTSGPIFDYGRGIFETTGLGSDYEDKPQGLGKGIFARSSTP